MYRDYCIDYFVPLYKCQRAKGVDASILFYYLLFNLAPFAGYYCCDLREAWEHCHYEDYMLRMKEYEREKRLLKRKLRKEMLAAVGE